MKNLRNLEKFVKDSKLFLQEVYCEIDGYKIPIDDTCYDSKTHTYYLLADSDANPISVKSLLKDCHKYPVLELVVLSEELCTQAPVKYFLDEKGDGNFGEPNRLVLVTE